MSILDLFRRRATGKATAGHAGKAEGKASPIDPYGSESTAQITARGGWEILAGSSWVKSADIWRNLSDADREQVARMNSVVFACCRYLATCAGDPPIEVVRKDDGSVVADHEMGALINRPNKYYSRNDLIQYIVYRLTLTGKAFVWEWRDGVGPRGSVGELWPIPTSWVTPKYGEGADLIAAWKVAQWGGTPKEVPPEDMVYMRFPDPSNMIDGLAPMAAATFDYQLDRERENYLVEILTNAKVPGLVLKQEKGTTAFDQSQRDDLRASMEDVTGYGRRGGTPILPPGVTIDFPGLLADMDWPGISSLSETRICAALGVPPILVGVRAGLDRSTYSNYGEARRSFYSTSMTALWRAIEEGLTRGILENEGYDDVRYRFDLSHIAELQEDQGQRATRATQLYQAGIATYAESRSMAGLSAPATDHRLAPITMTEVPVDTNANTGT